MKYNISLACMSMTAYAYHGTFGLPLSIIHFLNPFIGENEHIVFSKKLIILKAQSKGWKTCYMLGVLLNLLQTLNELYILPYVQ